MSLPVSLGIGFLNTWKVEGGVLQLRTRQSQGAQTVNNSASGASAVLIPLNRRINNEHGAAFFTVSQGRIIDRRIGVGIPCGRWNAEQIKVIRSFQGVKSCLVALIS